MHVTIVGWALFVVILVKVGPAHYSAAGLSPASSPNGQLTDITIAMIYGITAFAGFETAAALLVGVLTGLGFVTTVVNATIRVLFAMGRERVLPPLLSRLSRRHTPAVAIGCVGGLALVLGLPLTYAYGGARMFGYLAGAAGLSVVLIYLAVNSRPSARSVPDSAASSASGVT